MKILLKQIRQQKHLTLRRLETLSGVSNSEISRIENGEYQPTGLTLCCLARALQVTLCELIDCEDDK